MYSHRGFTLIELMVTISVAAIIMAIAVPSMQILRANSRVASAANELATDLKKART
ncbi:MAG TPA: prepilin-type N-terminal cleavage/methylation domain-containing protein, partial [Agitococcus sp.]|nr:prepilin-type N-terminal cleavage/methylation domain-containing protein [Pseudomonadales bacterium]HQV23159.1 prepilin-type N-terminal cleavage/methylation domain-containing protein [Agitococcus sp.]